jgi:acetyl-CoA synthetase
VHLAKPTCSDEPGQHREITYGELLREVCKVANVLISMGVKKGDVRTPACSIDRQLTWPGQTVAIYLPMVPEAVIAFLACARIGAIHSVVFAGFSAESLRDRIVDAKSRVVLTTDEGRRGGKTIATKSIVDSACDQCGDHKVEHVLVLERTGAKVKMTEGRDQWWKEATSKAKPVCPPVNVASETPLFVIDGY